MALAPIPRDQGSLSSLVYSLFPAPASCQAPLPALGALSPLHFGLRISPPASWPPQPCTLKNPSALLEAFLNI